MKVRILSGNETGAVKDLEQTEAENAIATGYAELYDPAKDQAALDAKNASEKKFGPASRKKGSTRKSAKGKAASKKGTRRKK